MFTMSALENKVPPPIVAFFFAFIMWAMSLNGAIIQLDETVLTMVVVVLILIGATFMFSALIIFKQVQTTVNPLKPDSASSLASTGIYQITRNPMYVGMALCLTAWAFYLTSILPFIGVFGFILYIDRFQIEPEERALNKIFGSDFQNYCAKVRRWL